MILKHLLNSISKWWFKSWIQFFALLCFHCVGFTSLINKVICSPFQAIHFVTKNQRGKEICEVALNILTCLLDLNIIERKKDSDKGPSESTEKKSEDEQSVTTDNGKAEITAFDLAMDSLIR